MFAKAQSANPGDAPAGGGIPDSEVLECLEHILASPAFAKVERPSRFLRRLVEGALRGEGAALKETVLGKAVFGRPADWNPREDPVVRQEAARLRKRLAHYYETDGAPARIRIGLPVGSYVPTFRRLEAEAAPVTAPSPEVDETPQPLRWPLIVGVAAVLAMAVALLGWRLLPSGAPAVPPVRREAEQLYLKGRFFWNKRTPESLTQAVDVFTQAVVHDPKYAPAYVGLADCYNLLREFATMPDKEAYPRSREAARRALELDDSLAEAHNSLAFVEFWWNWNAVGAERGFRRAIQLNPNYATAHHWFATFLFELGRVGEAQQQIEMAQKLDPASNAILADKALIGFINGHQEESIAVMKQMVEIDPGFSASHRYLSWMALSSGDYQMYLEEMKKGARLRGDPEELALADAGTRGLDRAAAKGMFEELLHATEQRYHGGRATALEVAKAHAWLGDYRGALPYLEISLQRREGRFPDVYSFAPFHTSRVFDDIKSRFREMMQTGLQR